LRASPELGARHGVLVTGRTWLPAIYLWLVPLVIVALPQIDPSVAGFIYLGFTGHLGVGLGLTATALWLLGCAAGGLLSYRASGPLRA
jgi:hypothetical protein